MNQLGLFAAPPASLDGADPYLIHKSYSADLIPSGKVRRPLSHAGDLWVCVGSSGNRASSMLEAYRLCPLHEYSGQLYTYSEKTAIWQAGDTYPGDFARNDPAGFYAGMVVSTHGQQYAMCDEQSITLDEDANERMAERELHDYDEEYGNDEEMQDDLFEDCEELAA